MRNNIGLFRGKSLDNGEWIEGHYFLDEITDDECYIVVASYPAIQTNRDVNYCFSCSTYHIDPETLGEFTGLTDVNGRRIWEGDIVKGSWDTTLVIYYDTCYLQFRAEESGGFSREIDYYGLNKLEVIGNIYENKDLIPDGVHQCFRRKRKK